MPAANSPIYKSGRLQTIEATLSISNFLYRVAAQTLVGDLTKWLTHYSRDAGYYTSCALRHPTAPPRLARTLKGQPAPTLNKIPNHIAYINRILHELGILIDTDKSVSIKSRLKFAHIDCELDLLPASTRHILHPQWPPMVYTFLAN